MARRGDGRGSQRRKAFLRGRRRLGFEPLEPRVVLDGTTITWAADIDWSQGDWGVKVTDHGTPGTAAVTVDLPGGVQRLGNALEVYYAVAPTDTPQFWVFTTDGFWRQTAYQGTWGTSGRLFRYFASSDTAPDKDRDRCAASHFQVVGVGTGGDLQLSLDYDNDSSVADLFDIHAAMNLLPPDATHTTVDATITVTNASGRDVTPAWDGHRALAEQWELLGLSSMYVADNLTGVLPAWYDTVDPGHAYVGVVDDGAQYLNDGFSVTAQTTVSTHDVKRLVVGDRTIDLAHEEADLPHVVVPGYEWYDQLALRGQPATDVRLIHAYDTARNQRLQLLGAQGLTSELANLEWSATYNRLDPNMVDGDNVQVKLGLDDYLNAWPAGASQTVQVRLTTGGFPFSMKDGRFWDGGEPVFVNGLDYQPLEPGQDTSSPIDVERLRDDLRRWQAYADGSDPLVLRVYPQPTVQYPIRLPQEFYDGVRQLGSWIVRDVFVPEDITDPDAPAEARQAVDAVLNEVLTTGAADRIFAWEIGNEFLGVTDTDALAVYLGGIREYLKQRLQETAFAGASNWVTWATYPGKDLLRTDGNRVFAPMDYYSINVYPYDPERIRDDQPGAATGTPFEGYLTALVDQVQTLAPGTPVLVTETGLPDTAAAVADQVQDRLHPWYPAYRKGGLNDQQVAEGLTDLYMAARLSDRVAGMAFFEWCDEWWKAGTPSQLDHPEEAYGLGRFVAAAGGGYELQSKLQQEVVRSLFQLDFHTDATIVTDLTAAAGAVPLGGETVLAATLTPTAVQPVRFRWETSRGRIVGDAETVQFVAGNVDLGPATVTCIAIDALGRVDSRSLVIDVQPDGSPTIEIYTLGTEGSYGLARVSGRVANVDLESFKVVLYVENAWGQYVQPYTDAPFVFAGADGYWWSPAHVQFQASGQLVAWVVPREFDAVDRGVGTAAPAGTIAEARWDTTIANDYDNDLLPDAWEDTYLAGLGQNRYGDVDGDQASNLEEYLAGRAAQFVGGGNPSVSDNDQDHDGLPDNWEYQLFHTLQFGANDDPDHDGLQNSTEYVLGIHPGRTAPDRDQDELPDQWEEYYFGNLNAEPGQDSDGDGVTNLVAYQHGLPPLSYFHAQGRDIVCDVTGEKMVFRGANLPGLDYGVFAEDFANGPQNEADAAYPGVLGTDYFVPRSVDVAAIAAHGFNVIRVPLEWARLVPSWVPGQPVTLDQSYLTLLDSIVQEAAAQELFVIPELHDYLVYWAHAGADGVVRVNNSAPHQALLAETWRLLAAHYAHNATILGYDLMNEPYYDPQTEQDHWPAIAQSVVDAIRQVDQLHLVLIEATASSSAATWPVEFPDAAIVDLLEPPRVVYSPHVYFDYDNLGEYQGPNEIAEPIGAWAYYVRDRLLPAIDWSARNSVPLLFGEMGTPPSAAWQTLVRQAYDLFFEPAQLSVVAWHYTDPAHNPDDPLNLALSAATGMLDTLDNYPPHTYTVRTALYVLPSDAPLYDEQRVNPWQQTGAGVGWWGSTLVDESTPAPAAFGQESLAVTFQAAWDGLKFVHQFGIDTLRFATLRFYIYPTADNPDVTIFTTGPLPAPCAEYPAPADRRRLSDFLPTQQLVAGRWQLVEVPLSQIVDPEQSVISGVALQAGAQAVPTFYLDQVALVSPWQNPALEETGRFGVDVDNDGVIQPLDVLRNINLLNARGPLILPVPAGGEVISPAFPDVNGDSKSTPLDALVQINDLNLRRARAVPFEVPPAMAAAEAGEGESLGPLDRSVLDVEMGHSGLATWQQASVFRDGAVPNGFPALASPRPARTRASRPPAEPHAPSADDDWRVWESALAVVAEDVARAWQVVSG
jgi:hypothetical protein